MDRSEDRSHQNADTNIMKNPLARKSGMSSLTEETTNRVRSLARNPFAKEPDRFALSGKAKIALGAAGLLLFIVGVKRSIPSGDGRATPEESVGRDPLL